MQYYAVMGNPIAHSKSPLIHTAFAQQFKIKLNYEKILVPSGELASALLVFQNRGGNGVNITLPLKEEAYQLVHQHTQRAVLARAVNTIIFNSPGLWLGDNTDGVGLIRDLLNNRHLSVNSKKLLVIGAGGATRGILAALLAEQPRCLVIANRTLEKAEHLVQEFGALGHLFCCHFEALAEHTFDLVINATSASTKGESLKLPFSLPKGAICYDLAYGDNAQPFLSWARECGASQCFDGLGMLVEQAAEAFYGWHGERPDTKPVIEMLLHDNRNSGEITVSN